jgi:hypothetical protein
MLLSKNASCFETVARVTLLLPAGKKSEHRFSKRYVYDAVYERGIRG